MAGEWKNALTPRRAAAQHNTGRLLPRLLSQHSTPPQSRTHAHIHTRVCTQYTTSHLRQGPGGDSPLQLRLIQIVVGAVAAAKEEVGGAQLLACTHI
jgi:hypothetical protein